MSFTSASIPWASSLAFSTWSETRTDRADDRRGTQCDDRLDQLLGRCDRVTRDVFHLAGHLREAGAGELSADHLGQSEGGLMNALWVELAKHKVSGV
jgi:hypothetical protein